MLYVLSASKLHPCDRPPHPDQAKFSITSCLLPSCGATTYTILGKTDLTIVQETVTDTLNKDSKQQKVTAKEAKTEISKNINGKLSGRKTQWKVNNMEPT
ncbi:hypothetical protein ILYODFUR_001491 [Ilyodon furcidens]|uniref:Uncharacterized protein n=1 Tax=Ilyodon furcidens TaxID=33524 RepID=A0ABV0T6Q3_9TELE